MGRYPAHEAARHKGLARYNAHGMEWAQGLDRFLVHDRGGGMRSKDLVPTSLYEKTSPI